MRIRFLNAFVFLASLAFLAAGCSNSGANLTPAPSVNQQGEGETVVRSVDGVRMTVEPDAWSGDTGVTRDVTPVRVSIRNRSDNPVAVRYQNFSLVASDGTRYAALPPFQVEGSVDAAEFSSGYGTINEPGFDYDGFGVSPGYGSVYGGDIGTYDDYGYGAADYGYYGSYGDYFDNVQLPTRAMVRRALPEGVIEPGGMVRGFLYFEKVDGSAVSRVNFRANVQDAGAGRTYGEITIPFTVSSS